MVGAEVEGDAHPHVAHDEAAHRYVVRAGAAGEVEAHPHGNLDRHRPGVHAAARRDIKAMRRAIEPVAAIAATGLLAQVRQAGVLPEPSRLALEDRRGVWLGPIE